VNNGDINVNLSIEARLMARLMRYARQHGTTPEALLLQSVEAFLDSRSVSELEPVDKSGPTRAGPRS
jgi:hypothetical protein